MMNGPGSQAQIQADDVRRLCGEILDWRIRAIVESGASTADVELAMARLTGADEMLSEQPQPLDGAAAAVYDLLVGSEDFPGDGDPGDRGPS